MSIKVSVVCATYNSPAGLDDLVASLDAQSLDPSEYEVVFVDDGSSDDTHERLQRIAAARTNVVVDRIPNSGWPGRPRNVGTRQARGEYVFFADHDDYLFPEALERMYDFAAENGNDVVHPKEVVFGWSAPGWRSWRSESPRVTRWDQHLVQCITPHKLYRRQFLLDQDIWFPEGKIRLEDFSFNGEAWAKTDDVGVLSSYPCYRWMLGDANSHKGGYDFEVYWRCFRDSLEPILEHVDDVDKRRELLIRWYRSRILERLNGQFQTHGERYRLRLLAKFADLLPLFGPELDGHLTPADRARSVLLRRTDGESLHALSRLDSGLRLRGSHGHSHWDGGKLMVSVTGTIVDEHGTPVPFLHEGGRLYRHVSDELRAAAGDDAFDVTDAVRAAFGEIVIRNRSSSVDWILDSRSKMVVTDLHMYSTVGVEITAAVDPESNGFGERLTEGVWDIFFRLIGLGYTATHRIPVPDGPDLPGLVHGRTAIGYTTKAGYLAVDIGSHVRTVPDPAIRERVRLKRQSKETILYLPTVHVAGESSIDGGLEIGARRRRARLVGDSGGARIVVSGRLKNTERFRTVFEGRRSRALSADGTAGAGPTRASAIGPGTTARRVARRLRNAIRTTTHGK